MEVPSTPLPPTLLLLGSDEIGCGYGESWQKQSFTYKMLPMQNKTTLT